MWFDTVPPSCDDLLELRWGFCFFFFSQSQENTNVAGGAVRQKSRSSKRDGENDTGEANGALRCS